MPNSDMADLEAPGFLFQYTWIVRPQCHIVSQFIQRKEAEAGGSLQISYLCAVFYN
jgi:hypothetical protein